MGEREARHFKVGTHFDLTIAADNSLLEAITVIYPSRSPTLATPTVQNDTRRAKRGGGGVKTTRPTTPWDPNQIPEKSTELPRARPNTLSHGGAGLHACIIKKYEECQLEQSCELPKLIVFQLLPKQTSPPPPNVRLLWPPGLLLLLLWKHFY